MISTLATIIWGIALFVLAILNYRNNAPVAKWCVWTMWLCLWIVVALSPAIIFRR